MPSLSGEFYYIRFRGLVSGPVETVDLRKMIQRGALSRLHELSPDQIIWQPAGRFVELFDESAAPPPAFAGHAPHSVSLEPPSPSIPGQERYYYSHKSATIGPITRELLTAQVQRGNVRANDLVWREGAPTAVMANQLEFLRSAFADAPPRFRLDGAKILLFIWIAAVIVSAVMVVSALLKR